VRCHHHLLPAVGQLLVARRLILDADAICSGFGIGQSIAPLYLGEAHAVQMVSVVVRGAGALEFLHANPDGGSGLQKMIGLKTHAAGTAIQHLCLMERE